MTSSLPARPRLVLHIGTHKTGTSALQQSLADARPDLLAHGVLYADTQRPPFPHLPQHCSVYHAAVAGDAQAQALERKTLCDEFAASGAHTLLLSEEGLSTPSDKVTQFFAPLASDFDTHVVCFLRRQDLFVESLFNQFVREKARHESRPLLGFLRAPGVRERLNYHAMLSRWKHLPAQVHALEYSAAVKGPGIAASFLGAIGISGLSLPESRSNVSPDMRLILAMNRMNRQRIDYDVHALLHASRQVNMAGLPPLKYLIGRDDRRRLLDDVAASNQALATDFGVQFAAETPPDEPPHTLEDLDPAFMLELMGRLSTKAQTPAPTPTPASVPATAA